MQFQQNQKISIAAGTVTLSGPVTISSITNPVTVWNDVSTLLNVSYNWTANYGNTFSVLQASAGLRLVIQPSLLNLDIGGTIGVLISNNTNKEIYQSTGIIGKFPPYGAGGSSGFQMDIPIAVDAGDTLQITLIDNQGGLGLGNPTQITLLGLSNPPVITPAPGIPIPQYPVGGYLHVSVTQGAAGTSALLAAPPTGTVYRMQRAVYSGGALGNPNGSAKMVLHTSGTRISDFAVLGTGTGTPLSVLNLVDNMDGLIVQEAVDFVTAAAAGNIDLWYDIIAVPVLQ